MPQTENVMEIARLAVAAHSWSEAYDLLTQDATELPADGLVLLAEAAWWTGRLQECINARERAYALHVAAGRTRAAGALATQLTKDHFGRGAGSVGLAWLGRAERSLDHEEPCIELGYLRRLQAAVAFEAHGDLETASKRARETIALAEQLGDRDLLALGIQDQGRILVAGGDVEEGMRLIDEATVGAVSGELTPMATGIVYCNTITVCEDLSDFRRASDWTDAAKRWCDRMAIAGFPGMCRVHRAGIMRRGGTWSDAEQEARHAFTELRGWNLAYAAEAMYELGEIRLLQGNLSGAEESFEQAHQMGREPQPGMARLRLIQGQIDTAKISIGRALDDEARDLSRARLLPSHVEIALAADDQEAARTSADELQQVAERYATPALHAAAAGALGLVLLAEGNAEEATKTLRRARAIWADLQAPWEEARIRLALAQAYDAIGHDEGRTMELRTARSAFERLGAPLDIRRADELLAEHANVPARAKRTLVFTDIVGSTDLASLLGDDAWGELLRWHDEALRALFSEHGGEEVKHTGDGFFVAFEDAIPAIGCAVAIQRRLADHRRQHGFAPEVRVGVHTADVTHADADYKGIGVHAAARIGASAGGSEILASTETLREREVRWPTGGSRTLTLKGLAQPIEVVAIEWR